MVAQCWQKSWPKRICPYHSNQCSHPDVASWSDLKTLASCHDNVSFLQGFVTELS